MRRRARAGAAPVAIAGAALSLVAALEGCAATPRARGPLFAKLDAERRGSAVVPIEARPEVVEADALRREAEAKENLGDPIAAELLLERARASLALGVARARQTEAAERTRLAKEGVLAARRDREAVEATEAQETKSNEEAVAKLASLRAQVHGTNLEPVTGAREKARRLAAEAALLDAAETCALARALGLRGPGVERATALLRAAEKRAGTGTQLLDAASSARHACLALHAPESARQAERRVTELDRGIAVASSMGLEASRDAIGLTFLVEDVGAELEALAAFVRAYGGVALVVDRRSDPGSPADLQSAWIAKALGNAEGVLQLAPRVALAEESKRRLLVRVAPRWPADSEEVSSVSEEP
jgi:hypothetical protein